MKKFDNDGLLLAEFQGGLFEQSTELDLSTPIFLRRFLHSDLLKKIDMNRPTFLSLDIQEGIDSINCQFGESNYGQEKYSAEAMFWIGYMYRYIAYTRETSTRFIMQIFNYQQMNKVYYSFHTQDPEWCITSLLEMNGLTENIFDKNMRLKDIMRAANY